LIEPIAPITLNEDKTFRKNSATKQCPSYATWDYWLHPFSATPWTYASIEL
jgi:hypothetical protein